MASERKDLNVSLVSIIEKEEVNFIQYYKGGILLVYVSFYLEQIF